MNDREQTKAMARDRQRTENVFNISKRNKDIERKKPEMQKIAVSHFVLRHDLNSWLNFLHDKAIYREGLNNYIYKWLHDEYPYNYNYNVWIDEKKLYNEIMLWIDENKF